MTEYDDIANLVYETFIRPALARGDKWIKIPVCDVLQDMNGAAALIDIHQVLGSKRFRDSFHLTPLGVESSGTYLPTDYTFDLRNIGTVYGPPPTRGASKEAA